MTDEAKIPEDHDPITRGDMAELRSLASGMRGDTVELIHAIGELVKSQTRPLKVAVWVISLVFLAFAGVTYYFVEKTSDLSEKNEALVQILNDNAVTACEGGNDRWGAIQGLWDGLILNSEAETPEEQHALDVLKQHVREVYKPRDCEHLDVPYKAPDGFPDLGLGHDKKASQ
jgi:hypothetical protein